MQLPVENEFEKQEESFNERIYIENVFYLTGDSSMSGELYVELTARSGIVYSGAAKSILLQNWKGEEEILPGHVSMISALKPGRCILKAEGAEFGWCLSEGFVSVEENKVRIAVYFAYTGEELDKESIGKDLKRALQRYTNKAVDDVSPETLEFLRAKALFDFAGKYSL